MAKKPHTELQRTPDGPWITLNTDIGSVTFNVREVVRAELPVAPPGRRRIMARWVKDRDAEGETAKVTEPDVPIGVRLGPRMAKKP